MTAPGSRSRGGLLLLGRWAGYVRGHPRPVEAAADSWRWLRTTFLGRDLLGAGLPWITFPAMRWLRGHLHPSMSVFEWGSGGSTIFLAQRAGRVVSIEYDQGWCQAVEARLRETGLQNAQLRYFLPEPGAAEPRYRSSGPEFAGLNFRRYIESILEFPDASFDVVLVDGRARRGCVVAALPKLKPEGVLVLDNSDREDAVEACALLSGPDWVARHFPGPGPNCRWPAFWKTTVFRRAGVPATLW